MNKGLYLQLGEGGALVCIEQIVRADRDRVGHYLQEAFIGLEMLDADPECVLVQNEYDKKLVQEALEASDFFSSKVLVAVQDLSVLSSVWVVTGTANYGILLAF